MLGDRTLRSCARTFAMLAVVLASKGLAQDPPTRTEAPPPAATECARSKAWRGWAADHAQRVESIADGRVLVIAAAKEELTKAQRKVIDGVVAKFDELFGPAPREPRDPGVFFCFSRREHVNPALDELARLNPYASTWANAMRSSPSDFTIDEPLASGIAPFFADGEEWSADHELAHRLAHVLLVQRFGHQPYWLVNGFGWIVEQDVLGSIYCFPYRSGFVAIGSHGGWAPDLVQQFKARKKSPVTMAEIASLERGAFDEAKAARAWGAMRFLTADGLAELPAILRELDAAWQREGRETKPDGKWIRRANFELPAESQQRIFAQHLQTDVWQRMTNAFAGGLKSATAKRDKKTVAASK